jgi:tripeptide aminopeptidase
MIPINQERLVKQFMDFVRIDSPIFAEAPFVHALGEELSKLGLRWENDRTGQNGAGNLLALLPGTAPEIPPVLLCMHMDTVEPGRGIKPRLENGEIRSDGTTVLGADSKAAIASTLEAIRWLQADRPPHGDMEFFFTWGRSGGTGEQRRSITLGSARKSVLFPTAGAPSGPSSPRPLSPNRSRRSFRAAPPMPGFLRKKGSTRSSWPGRR